MPPVHAELSMVSLPLRERILAKCRAKAIANGQPLPQLTKRMTKVPTLTLAGTRQRRSAAMDVAYLRRPDGIHITQVVRRAPPQMCHQFHILKAKKANIPHSDEDSNDRTDDGTVTTVPEIGLPMITWDIDVDMGAHINATQLEDSDYDAEGEDDDDMIGSTGHAPINNTFNAAWEHTQSTSAPQTWTGISAQPNDFINDASDEDFRALFSSLDNFPANSPSEFPGSFPPDNFAASTLGLDTNAQGPGYFGRYFQNVRLLACRPACGPLRVPTVLELQTNAAGVYKLTRWRNRKQLPTTTESARSWNILSSAALTPDQRTVMSRMEYHVTKDVMFDQPWPGSDLRKVYLSAAADYTTRHTGVGGDGVFTEKFLDMVFSKAPGNRSNPLAKIAFMVEHEFDIEAGGKWVIYGLMDKDQFLYPNVERNPSEYFCVGVLGSTLEIMLFKVLAS
ncbi:hypothetical protein FRC06_004317 [Ceratobasidium sp. 370]|nr:hypothetical protein FRC06_004317 [Ceratobasidium sp. 370]